MPKKQCKHERQTRAGSNMWMDQVTCLQCKEILFRHLHGSVDPELLRACTTSREVFGSFNLPQGNQGPEGPQGNPGQDADPVDVATALSDDDVFRGILAQNLVDQYANELQGPEGPQGPQGVPGPAVSTSAVCYVGSSTSYCSATCINAQHVVAEASDPCSVTSDTGSCNLDNLPGEYGWCCVCSPTPL